MPKRRFPESRHLLEGFFGVRPPHHGIAKIAGHRHLPDHRFIFHQQHSLAVTVGQ
jgi:hypothetical protein